MIFFRIRRKLRTFTRAELTRTTHGKSQGSAQSCDKASKSCWIRTSRFARVYTFSDKTRGIQVTSISSPPNRIRACQKGSVHITDGVHTSNSTSRFLYLLDITGLSIHRAFQLLLQVLTTFTQNAIHSICPPQVRRA